jgi:outer membrane lipoprotein-sorting protein
VLIDNRLLEYIDGEQVHKTTDKGNRFLKIYDQIGEYVTPDLEKQNLCLNNDRERIWVVSPKRRVAVMTAIFSAFGVGVSVAIIAAGGGFSAPGRDLLKPPTSGDIWIVGANIKDGMALDYSLTGKDETSSLDSAHVSIFFKEQTDGWQVRFNIVNDTRPPLEKTIIMSKELTRVGELDESFRPYFEPIQSSIFHVRDMEYGQSPKYLVVGAPWDEIFYHASEVIVRVTGEENVQTQAGTFHSFVLGYKLAEKTSKIWVVKDLPLPVKAEVYDPDDNLQYKYELVGAAGL